MWPRGPHKTHILCTQATFLYNNDKLAYSKHISVFVSLLNSMLITHKFFFRSVILQFIWVLKDRHQKWMLEASNFVKNEVKSFYLCLWLKAVLLGKLLKALKLKPHHYLWQTAFQRVVVKQFSMKLFCDN